MSDISERADRFVRGVFKKPVPAEQEAQARETQKKVDRLRDIRDRLIKQRKGF